MVVPGLPLGSILECSASGRLLWPLLSIPQDLVLSHIYFNIGLEGVLERMKASKLKHNPDSFLDRVTLSLKEQIHSRFTT